MRVVGGRGGGDPGVFLWVEKQSFSRVKAPIKLLLVDKLLHNTKKVLTERNSAIEEKSMNRAER